ncbi:hypothetical protein PP175_25220 (plasmid) [Aneurinibacillus sp. Ricciae_BoGa-3]|uniref:hypothetical protein n=1 Tax=Aneurinibacillus sp. Ricciae_BoGa-3 TaxID=3022697 RepID=UPI0023417A9F|nr:hypothetical protein [Aneurinibacillus sp. Ricciae_BoGa-3]WCK57370.1 hypothetical protein PP175_25220 [Aneurinibacillus sp. Ricciae_BoGa-3]
MYFVLTYTTIQKIYQWYIPLETTNMDLFFLGTFPYQNINKVMEWIHGYLVTFSLSRGKENQVTLNINYSRRRLNSESAFVLYQLENILIEYFVTINQKRYQDAKLPFQVFPSLSSILEQRQHHPYASGSLNPSNRNDVSLRPITIHGITKPLYQWAEETNVPFPTVLERFRRGWTDEAVFDYPKLPERTKKSVSSLTIKGETKTIIEWASFLKITVSGLKNRLKANWTEEELLLPCSSQSKIKSLTIKGETKTLIEWAEIIGIGSPALLIRIKKGWMEDELLVPPYSKQLLTIHGQTGISRLALQYRIKQGCNDDELLLPSRTQRKMLTVKGQVKPLIEWAEEMGISLHTLHARIKRGWMEDELFLPPSVNRKRQTLKR